MARKLATVEATVEAAVEASKALNPGVPVHLIDAEGNTVATVAEMIEGSEVAPVASGRKVRMIDANGPLFAATLAALGITGEAFDAAYDAAPRTRNRAPSAKAIAKARALLARIGEVA